MGYKYWKAYFRNFGASVGEAITLAAQAVLSEMRVTQLEPALDAPRVTAQLKESFTELSHGRVQAYLSDNYMG